MIYPLGFESNLVVFIYLLVKDDYLYIYLLSIFLSRDSFIEWILFLSKKRGLDFSLCHLSYSFQLSTKSSLSSTHFSAPAIWSSSFSCTSTIKSYNSSFSY